jgi:hypothetical protein
MTGANTSTATTAQTIKRRITAAPITLTPNPFPQRDSPITLLPESILHAPFTPTRGLTRAFRHDPGRCKAVTSAFKRSWVNALCIAQLVLHPGSVASVPPEVRNKTKAAIAGRCL